MNQRRRFLSVPSSFCRPSRRQISVAFRSWLERTALHANQRGPRLPRLLSRLKTSNLSVALKKWARAAASLADLERSSRTVVVTMRRALKQMRDGNLAMGLRKWKTVHGAAQRHARCRRCVRRLARRKWDALAGGAFSLWRTSAAAHAAKQKVMRRVVRRLQRRDQSAAVGTLHDERSRRIDINHGHVCID